MYPSLAVELNFVSREIFELIGIMLIVIYMCKDDLAAFRGLVHARRC